MNFFSITLPSLFRLVGIDKAIFFSILRQGWGAFAGPITLFFVVAFLTPSEQGYYYTMFSLIGARMLFNAGLGQVLTQYIVHALSRGTNKADLRQVYRISLYWYGFSSIALFFGVVITGFYVFSSKSGNNEITWLGPLLLVSLGASIGLVGTPLSSIATGFNRVKDVMVIGLISNIILTFVIWESLAFGWKLYSVGFALLVGSVISLILPIYMFSSELRLCRNSNSTTSDIRFLRDVFPLQSKVACSWAASYVLTQGLTPIVFATMSAVIAGRFGLVLSVALLVTNLAMGWVSTKAPTYGGLVASRDWDGLTKVVKKSCIQMMAFCFVAFLVLFLGFALIWHLKLPICDRVLGLSDILFLFIFYFSRLPAVALNVFNCAFKKDWIYQVQAINAIFVLLCAYTMLGHYDVSLGVTLLVLAVSQYFVFLPIMVGVTYRGVRDFTAD